MVEKGSEWLEIRKCRQYPRALNGVEKKET